MLSKSEWKQEAERAAARKMGEDNAGWFFFRRFLAGPAGIMASVAGLALGARWAWDRMSGTLSAPDHSSASAFWFVLGLMVIASAVAFRPRVVPTPAHLLLAKLLVFGLLWLGLIAYGIAFWLS